ncbi:MAG TPA: lamin tail domain-containing protein, partial [Verrucomicrobiae bacterium]|nr:lamin tail domain-containing protein [Verrucomicrobiae bacterium]
SEIARLYQALRPNPEFRLLWADRIQKHFFNGGALTGLNISNRFNELRAQIEPSFSPAQAMDIEILQWARDRFPIVMGQLNTYGLYGYSNALYGIFASSNAPVFNQHGGRVASGFTLTMTNPLGGPIYYTMNGDDPRVPFSAAVSNSALTYTDPITLNQTVVIKARSLHNGTNWSALSEAEFKVEALIPTLRITEIMYNPTGGNGYEFIELQNYGATPVNVSGMTFSGINFTFPQPTILAPGARIVLSSDANPAGFAQRYPGVSVAGRFGGALNNGGETITLLDRNGNTVLSVSYGNSGLWPASANGGGYSLVLADPTGDPDDPLSWRASIAQNGSPGAGDVFPPPTAGVVISEVSAASSPQWIELHNQGSSSVDLAGYSLTDDGQARKYILPSIVIGAGQYAVVYPSNYFTLSARGDEVSLYSPQTNLLHRTSYGLQPAGYTIALVNNDWALGNPTPGAANAAAALGTASGLIINEWMANALSSEDDWLELWNNSAQPVSLQGVYVGVSNALFRISSRSFIGPYGFAQLFADEDPGPDHVDLRLPASGATIVVYDLAGAEVNRVTYGTQAENISQGRLPDGSATLRTFAGSASPGAANYVSTYAGPYLNEVMARNVSAVTNGQGRVADWIEIFNPSVSAVDLGGMSLSVDAPEPSQWVFPSGSLVPASGRLVVWCDGDLPASTTFEATLNCGHSLNGNGGGVYLFSAAGQLVNSVEYGFQLPNQSIGPTASSAAWRLLQTFTPGGTNGPVATLGSATNVTFNEWMADPAHGDDWFELYNSGSQPVDLGGLILTDDPSMAGADKFRVPALSFIAAKGYVRYEADGNQGNGFDHVNFSLDAGGESLRLNNGTTFAPIASVYFGPQAFGVSEGRLPDGAATIARFPGSETPGESNYQLPGNVLINEVLASGNQVELYNSSSDVANIGGWFLSNTSADYKLYRIPDGTSVPAGGYRVITPGFSLNTATGGEIILAVADAAGNLNGQRVHASYGPHDAGVAFGRFATSQGVEFVALAQPTLGAANASARVGPVVINEIMYNPLPGGIEYVELLNISSSGQSLSGWRLANAVNVLLPDQILPAGGFLVVEIGLDQGHLDNNGERLDLLRPGGIVMDSIDYKDSTPWPSGPVDGEGLSLQRRNSTTYGNEPLNWLASIPTPEEANPATADLPVIDVPPQSYDVPTDTILTLSVEASGGEPLGYQWRFNGVAIPGANDRELALNLVQIEHAGSYDVLVSNPAGATLSPAATVFVAAAPSIIAPLVSQSIQPGASATFTVVARASPPISYQWSFNGAVIPGVNGTTYSVANAGVPQIGDYSVRVSNPMGNVTSSAYLAVLVPPSFLLQPVAQTVVEGDDATFRLAVTGLPPFGYRWRRPGVAQVTNAIGWDTPIITFTNVPMTYSNNNIDCIVSNPVRPAPGGVQSRVVKLFVLPDADHDKLPDAWEIANGFNTNDASDAATDTDGDGVSNRQEYLAGTDPRDSNSFLRVRLVNVNLSAPAALLSFNAVSNKTYSVLYNDELSAATWSKLLDVESEVTNRLMQVTDPNPSAASRYYKLATPATR